MDILEKMECVRLLAEAHETCLQKEKNLDKKIKPLIPLLEIQVVEEPTKEKYRNWAIFGACEVAFAFIINKALEFILSYFANDCMTQAQALEAGQIGYHNVSLFFGVGALLALPVAWLAKKLICLILAKSAAKEASRAKKANEERMQHNLNAAEENKRIAEANRVAEEEIEKIQAERNQLLADLKNTAPWYDPAYLSPKAVDYVTAQLKSGKARTLNEAYALYEWSLHQ